MCLDHLFSYQSTLKRKEEESLNNLCCCVDKMKATQPQSSVSMFRRCSVLVVFLRFMAPSKAVIYYQEIKRGIVSVLEACRTSVVIVSTGDTHCVTDLSSSGVLVMHYVF